MKNRFTVIYTVFASLIFVFSISFFAFNLYKEYSYGPTRTSSTFNTITSEIRNKSKTNTPEEIASNLNKHFDKYFDFAYIKITYNNKEILKYPSNISEYNASSNLTKKYKSSISTENGSFYIDCDLYLLRPYSIFYYAKISFLIILIITILTVIMIIYLNMNTEISNSVSEEVDNEPVLADINVSTENITTISEPAPVSNEEPKETVENETLQESENLNDNVDNAQQVVLPSEEVKPAKIDVEVETSNVDDKPEGLFNPVTGFGWNQYLITRLDSEINRAIASEIDLALFVIQLPGLDRSSEIIKNVCNYLAIQFQFKDLLFEYKDDCLVAMKISMDIDEALNFADKIYLDIKNIIQNNDCYMGISTRSIRMVSGERLLHEADEALKHTQDDKDSPIIAFRVDAEKYRQFLEKND